ncbi:MAG TPA: cbb3-type cytochrome oxidase assembly protein CcoS [Gammaproteobacteria bacterium]
MEVIYTLIPGMILFGLLLVGVLIWAVKKGQYEDFEGDGQRILMDDDEPTAGTPAGGRKISVGKNFPDADD